MVAVASTLCRIACRNLLRKVCLGPACLQLRTGVEQVSVITSIERGSADCEPSGNAHRTTKATGQLDVFRLVGLANRQKLPTFLRDWVRPNATSEAMVATHPVVCDAGQGYVGPPESYLLLLTQESGLAVDERARWWHCEPLGKTAQSRCWRCDAIEPLPEHMSGGANVQCDSHGSYWPHGMPSGKRCPDALLSYRITAAGLLG